MEGIGTNERFHAPLTGVRLGRYLLGERLGAGGAASVYLAQLRGPHDFERVLAVKVVHEHLTESTDFVNMFLDEANLAVRLTHPSIVHSYELGRHGPHLFLAMEYLSGQPLSKLMARMKDLRERIDPRIVAWIGARASEALAYAHALTDEAGKRVSLVHRDVSPQNLFLTYDGHVKVIDFGIAHAEGRLTHTGLGRIKGKFSYMAPEQMLKQGVDHRADLFSLGATLYEAALGARPFEAEDEAEAIAMLLEETAPKPEERIPGFPESLSKILLHALEREPADRYGDGTRMARDLDDFVRATGSAEMAPELARLMTRCFAAEREAQARAVASLRGMEARRLREPVGSTTTADPIASSIRPSPRRPDRRWLIFGATVLCAVIIGSVAVFARHGPASSDAAPSSTVAVAKAITPTPASAEVASVGSGDAPLVAPAPPSAFAPSPASPTVRAPQSPSKALSPKAAPRDAKSLPPKPPAKKRGDSLVTDYPF